MANTDELIENLEALKWWITLYVTGDLTCGEVREKLEVVDEAIEELKKKKVA